MLKVYDRRSKGRQILEVIERVRAHEEKVHASHFEPTVGEATSEQSIVDKIMGRHT